MRLLPLSAAVALLLLGSAAAGAAPAINLAATDLNGRAVKAPGATGRTLVLLGFRHGDQDVLDGWRTGLGLKDDDPSWIEIAYIGAPSIARGMIETSLRKRFDSPAARAHMASVFGSPDAALKPLAAGESPVVLVLDSAGAVLAEAHGGYSPANAKAVSAAR